jgi:glyoxylate reductase
VKVFVTTDHPGTAIERLTQRGDVVHGKYEPLSRAELLQGLQDCDAVICILRDRIDAELMDACPKLKLVANVAVGFDNIDVPAATSRKILVTNTPGVLDETTADMAFALLLATSRRIVEADRYVRDRNWQGFKIDLLLSTDVHHKTLGIVGFGRIGQAVARRARGFGMQVLYTKNTPGEPEAAAQLDAQRVDMDDLLRRSDFVSLHCPLNPHTRHLMSTAQFNMMKRSAFLINTARGAVVDEPALISALQEGLIAGAGLDVFEDEPNVPAALTALPNVVLAPHLASATVETRSAMTALAVDAVIKAFELQQPANSVNPEIWPAFAARIEKAAVE